MKEKITATLVKSLEPKDKPYWVWDSELPGFGVRVSETGRRSFVVFGYCGRERKRITIGKSPPLTVHQGREKARELLANFELGKDPTAKSGKLTSLQTVFDDFLESKPRRPNTRRDYMAAAGLKGFGDLMDKPITAVTRAEVREKFKELTEQRGPAWANLAARVMRAVFNHAKRTLEDESGNPLILSNPFEALSGQWNKVEPRSRHITASQLPAWGCIPKKWHLVSRSGMVETPRL